MSIEDKIKNAKQSDFFDDIPKEEHKKIISQAKEESKKMIDSNICNHCTKSWTDDCPKEKCWSNNYSEYCKET